MKKSSLILGLLCFAADLVAGEQTLRVTPASLDAWTVTGTDKEVLSSTPTLILPPSSQLSRHFDTDKVIVAFKADVPFGVASEDLVILEVGEVAMAFSQVGTEGQLVLVTGDASPMVLPIRVSLDSEGSNLGLVELQIAYERSTGSVSVTGFGQTLHYSSGTHNGPVEIVFTTGAHEALPLDDLSIQLQMPEPSGDQKLARDQDPTNGPEHAADAKRKPVRGTSGPAEDSLTTRDSQQAEKKSAEATSRPTLEVFTPTASRHRRVDAVRKTVVEALKS